MIKNPYIFNLFIFLFVNSESIEKKVTSRDLIDLLRFKPNSINRISILSDHKKLSDEFYDPNNPTRDSIAQLAYVTPWNNHGYDLAKQTSHKLSHISPVWLQAKPEIVDGKLSNCKIEGAHDIDQDWIEKLREKNQKIKIVPRIIFDGWTKASMEELVINTQMAIKCSKTIANFYNRNNFDGAVVESYIQGIVAFQSLQAKTYIIEMMEQLAKVMKKAKLLIIYTVPAPLEWNNTPNQLVTPTDYKQLLDFSDHVQIMTYDYRGEKPTGVAPYDWMENCVYYLGAENSLKTLIGLNWYGYEFSANGVEPVTFGKYLDTLKLEDAKLSFDEEAMEHRLETKSSIIYYPSLTSLELRTSMAHRYNCGIAIWDYGQGLDYFSKLLV